MEVHHHSHSQRKKWTHYFWEFLMLFLAVFCGFLAENEREHYIESKREKQFMSSLCSDLKKDTAFYRRFINNLLITTYRLDSLIELINSDQYKTEVETFYRLALYSRSITYFEYQNSTFEQLKSSGSLRLIRDKRIQDSLLEYNNAILRRVQNQETRYMNSTADVAKAIWEIADSRFFEPDAIIPGRELPNRFFPVAPVWGKIDEEKMFLLKNLFFERKLLIAPYLNFVLRLNERAKNLILSINEKYHLE